VGFRGDLAGPSSWGSSKESVGKTRMSFSLFYQDTDLKEGPSPFPLPQERELFSPCFLGPPAAAPALSSWRGNSFPHCFLVIRRPYLGDRLSVPSPGGEGRVRGLFLGMGEGHGILGNSVDSVDSGNSVDSVDSVDSGNSGDSGNSEFWGHQSWGHHTYIRLPLPLLVRRNPAAEHTAATVEKRHCARERPLNQRADIRGLSPCPRPAGRVAAMRLWGLL